MPSVSLKQAKLMRPCSNPKGRKYMKSQGVECPPQKVAREFVKADKKSGKFRKGNSRVD